MIDQCVHEMANDDLHLYVVRDRGYDLCQANSTRNEAQLHLAESTPTHLNLVSLQT